MSDLGSLSQQLDWAHLPPELLRLISQKAGEVGDYVRFRSVCKSWRSTATPGSLPPQIPWLLLPYHPNDTLRRFRSFSTNKIYSFDSPIFRGHVIHPSAHGWLLLAELSLRVSLFHPITKAHIHLPPLPASHNSSMITSHVAPHASNTTSINNWITMLAVFTFYAFMSEAGDHIVVLITHSPDSPDFLYCRVRDNAWIRPALSRKSAIHSVTYHRGRLYIIHEKGEVEACELSPEVQFTLLPSLPVPKHFTWYYLVRVAADLFLVTYPHHIGEEKQHCDYYKLNAEGQLKWSKIQDIGHNSLFLTLMDNAMAAGVGNASGCKSNHIYVSGDLYTFPIHRFYIVSMEDGMTERILHYEEECGGTKMTSSWFMPTLC